MSDDHTVPDPRARYSANPWSAFIHHVDGPAEPPVEPRRSYRAHLGIDAIPGVSARAKATVQALWADADFGAIESGEPALVWTSAPTLAKRMGVSARTAKRGLRAAAIAGLVIRLSDYIDGRRVWTKDRGLVDPSCQCEPGKWSTDLDCCCCRVLVPVDRDGRVMMVLSRARDMARRERISRKIKAGKAQPGVKGVIGYRILQDDKGNQPHDKGDTRPIPLGDQSAINQDRSANTADPGEEPWHVAHRCEHDPWVEDH